MRGASSSGDSDVDRQRCAGGWHWADPLRVEASRIDLGTLLGGIGIGAIVGSGIAFINGERQRAHDREMRAKDYGQQALAQEAGHRQELVLRQLEDKQRLRDRRLATLQDGLSEIVEGFAALTDVVVWTREGSHQEEVDRARVEAARHFDLARPRLLLDPVGREVMQTFRAIQIEILVWTAEADRGAKVALDAKIMKMLTDAVDRAQQIMEKAAQPVTV